ncbi:MAG: EVE domain-containing protein [Acidimicrobiia bacterium]|nr:EVE domain-containing protein [Acidimicrobiia bacterium]
MAYFLAKTEPSTYSIQQLALEKRTVWDGVRNAQALKAIRQMKKGDRIFIYHSGGESRVVGLADVLSDPRPDPSDAKLTVIDLGFACFLEPGITLGEIKQSGKFNDWALVRQSRLSTMAAPEAFVNWIRKLHPKVKI